MATEENKSQQKKDYEKLALMLDQMPVSTARQRMNEKIRNLLDGDVPINDEAKYT